MRRYGHGNTHWEGEDVKEKLQAGQSDLLYGSFL